MSEPQAVEEFLMHLEKERDVSPNTLIAYRRDLEEFVSFLGRYYGAEEWSSKLWKKRPRPCRTKVRP